MAKYKLLLPKMGESVAEATIIKWSKNPGDFIEIDETVMEIATDKVDSEVPSPVSGKLLEQLYKDNDVVQVGSVIAVIETVEVGEAKEDPIPDKVEEQQPSIEASQPAYVGASELGLNQPDESKQQVFADYREQLAKQVPYTEQLEQKSFVKTEDAGKSSSRFYSPLVKNIAAQEGINNAELDEIPGTGAEGRLTKDDLLGYIQNRHQSGQTKAPITEHVNGSVESSATAKVSPASKTEDQESRTAAKTAIPQPETPKQEVVESKITVSKSVSGGDEIIEMDRMRRLIADHMVMSKHTSPHVTSFVEADVTNLVMWREGIKNSFEKKEGEKITFTPIFIEAVVKAIKDLPMINISVNGTQIIKKKDINISMATALPNGNLIVPVIKKADELNLLGLTKAVNDLANRARNNKLKPDDVQDGTFTITNVGSFGNVMGTPIINQPQVAILAVGAIRKKPAVIETEEGDMIGIRHMMFLSLSYDHRVVDGALGGSFVKRVADYLENWDKDREI